MGFDVSDLSRLGPAAQSQILEQMMAQRKAEPKKAAKKAPKLNNQKCTMTYKGESRQFDSKKEGHRWMALRAMEDAGLISDLRCQVVYDLIPKHRRSDGKLERSCKYVADFVYRDGDKEIVEDVKGYRNPSSATYAKFAIKRKLMLDKYGIEIREV